MAKNAPNTKKKSKQEELFEKQLAINIMKAKELTNHPFGRVVSQIEKYGSVKACKITLGKGQFSDGFQILAEKKLLQYSVESIAVDQKFTSLFTDEEVNFAFEVLCENDYFTGR